MKKRIFAMSLAVLLSQHNDVTAVDIVPEKLHQVLQLLI